MTATPSDEELRALAREILAHEPYAEWRQQPGGVWRALADLGRWAGDGVEGLLAHLPAAWRDALAALWDRLRAGLERSVGGGLDEPWVRAVLGLILAAVIGLLVVQLAIALRGSGALPRRAPRRPGPRAGEPLADAARRLAREGRHLEAAHCLELAALELLLERRWLELGPSEPNRTLRRRLRASRLPGSLGDEFVRLLDRLEEHWFRDRRGEHELYEAWQRLHDRLSALPEAV